MHLTALLLFWHVLFAACAPQNIQHHELVSEVESDKGLAEMGYVLVGFGAAGAFGYFTGPNGKKVKVKRKGIRLGEARKAVVKFLRNPNKALERGNRQASINRGKKTLEMRKKGGPSDAANGAGRTPYNKDMSDAEVVNSLTDEEREQIQACVKENWDAWRAADLNKDMLQQLPDQFGEPDPYLFIGNARHDCVRRMLVRKVAPRYESEVAEILSRDEYGYPASDTEDQAGRTPVRQAPAEKEEMKAAVKAGDTNGVLKFVDDSPSITDKFLGAVQSSFQGFKNAFGISPSRPPPPRGVPQPGLQPGRPLVPAGR